MGVKGKAKAATGRTTPEGAFYIMTGLFAVFLLLLFPLLFLLLLVFFFLLLMLLRFYLVVFARIERTTWIFCLPFRMSQPSPRALALLRAGEQVVRPTFTGLVNCNSDGTPRLPHLCGLFSLLRKTLAITTPTG